jgi:uncharacterized membrane protein YdjX (TVP38/TMEM64 family)
MKRIWIVVLCVLGFSLMCFALAELLGLSMDQHAPDWIRQSGALGMLLSVALLVADVFLPVPSSMIMIVNGALYGPWLGAMLSILGGVGATCAGYALGRSGHAAVRRWVSDAELERARLFFKRWGVLAVIVSRPVPLLAETVAIMAGLSGWGFGRTLVSAIGGVLPVAVIYAISGAMASQQDYGLATFFLVLGIGAIAWWGGRLIGRRVDAKAGRQL